jgi:hypothetical protein
MDTVKMGQPGNVWRLVIFNTCATLVNPLLRYNTIGELTANVKAVSGGGVLFTDRSKESIEHEQLGYLFEQYNAGEGWRNHMVTVTELPYTARDLRHMANYMENK